jgi:hypothetical protein
MVGRAGTRHESTASLADGHGHAVHDWGAAMAIIDATRRDGAA